MWFSARAFLKEVEAEKHDTMFILLPQLHADRSSRLLPDTSPCATTRVSGHAPMSATRPGCLTPADEVDLTDEPRRLPLYTSAQPMSALSILALMSMCMSMAAWLDEGGARLVVGVVVALAMGGA